jgi:hypothetical protein
MTQETTITTNQLGKSGETASGKIQIENGVAIPKMRIDAKYPWQALEVGQSFLFPAETKMANAYSSAWGASKANAPKKFIARKTDDGFRCWRIA